MSIWLTPGRWRSQMLAFSVLAGFVLPGAAAQSDDSPGLRIEGNSIEIVFDPIFGKPVRWRSCYPDCKETNRELETVFVDASTKHGPLMISTKGSGAPALGPVSNTSLRETGSSTVVEFTNRLPGTNGVLVQRYEVPQTGYLVRYQADFRNAGDYGLSLGYRIATGSQFSPQPMPGFSSGYASVRRIVINQDESQQESDIQAMETLAAGDWAGVRSRFWALLARSDNASLQLGGEDPELVLYGKSQGQTRLDLEFYSGPVAAEELEAVGGGMSGLLFAHVWSWIKPLCHGLKWILALLLPLVGHAGLAIMLLSLIVKILMYPLTYLAERWQSQVNEIQARLQPALEKAKAGYKGEERHERILAAYRDQGVHPLFAMKSLFGYMIQIPVFIAAFAMLGENIALAEVQWLWVDDLSRPDALFAMPFSIPFFGSNFNLLPLVMTLLSIVAAIRHVDPLLTDEMLRSQRHRLYFLSALFFVLFYTFPAGMVLYWTTNNLLHVLGSEVANLRRRASR